MRRLTTIVLALALGTSPALAAARVLCRDGTWVKVGEACRHRGGVAVAGPPARHRVGRQPPPRARCRDGSVQFASTHTCRYRGGVAYWM